LFYDFGGKKLKKVTIGEPLKVLKEGSLTIWRDIRVSAEFESESGNSIKLESADVFKAIVEVNGVFRHWNITYE
jgi:hypothetical protein